MHINNRVDFCKDFTTLSHPYKSRGQYRNLVSFHPFPTHNLPLYHTQMNPNIYTQTYRKKEKEKEREREKTITHTLKIHEVLSIIPPIIEHLHLYK